MSEEDLKKIEDFLDLRNICYLAGADTPTWEVKMLAKLYEEYIKLREQVKEGASECEE